MNLTKVFTEDFDELAV